MIQNRDILTGDEGKIFYMNFDYLVTI